jgi:hypothetical protein
VRWVRGGLWISVDGVAYPYPDAQYHTGFIRWLEVAPLVEKRAAELGIPAREALPWDHAPLDPLQERGLSEYELTEASAPIVLSSYNAFVTNYGYSGQYFIGGSYALTTAYLALCGLIAEHGPLTPTDAIPGMRWARRAHLMGEPNGIQLLNLWRDIDGLASCFGHLPEHGRGRVALAERIKVGLLDALRADDLSPQWFEESHALEVTPADMRTFLWWWLYRQVDRNVVTRCVYCSGTFPLKGGPGRPPLYCPEHRAPKYRQAVRARKPHT